MEEEWDRGGGVIPQGRWDRWRWSGRPEPVGSVLVHPIVRIGDDDRTPEPMIEHRQIGALQDMSA